MAVQTAAPKIDPTALRGTWTIDPAHSSVAFVARHLMVSKVRGTFGAFGGTVHVGWTPADTRAEVRIEAASIDTGAEQRDAHLRSPDFLDAERYPALTYRSTRVEAVSDRSFRLHGELTIRDRTRPVVLDVSFDGTTPDLWGNDRASFTAAAEIDRHDWDMTWNQALETGGVLVGRRVRIELDVTLVRARQEATT